MRVILIYFLFFVSTNCLPLSKKVLPTYEQVKFMQKFGYLGGGNSGFEAQYAESAIDDAIITMQTFGGIPQTGILDQETLKLMTKKRCGVKDVIQDPRQKRFAVITPGWNKREITYFIANWSPKLSEYEVARDIQKALNTWAVYGNLIFIRRYDPLADIVITFSVGHHGDGFPFDGPGNILAHAFFPSVALGGDVHFDNDENWNSKDPLVENDETTNFYSVALHELGHSLGLAHSKVSSSIMAPYYKNSPSLQLDYDDIMAMYELYIKSPVDNEIRLITRNQYDDEIRETTTETERFTFSDSGNRFQSTTSPRDVEETTIHNYHGDVETVDVHALPKTPLLSPTDICDGIYDTLTVIRRELFVFRDNMVWRFRSRNRLIDGYPATIQSVFHNFPQSLNKVDAAYEQKNGTILFTSGTNYWQYVDNNTFGPFPLSNIGITNVRNIDAIFTWKKNKKTYIFQGNQFWRMTEETTTMDSNYPMNINRWTNIPPDIDAVMEWTDGSTYFFKGPLFWRFDNILIQANKHYPLPTLQYWFGCPEEADSFLILQPENLQ